MFFFIFNKLFLSKETFHTFNRFTWLFVAGLSFVLPLFEWHGFDAGDNNVVEQIDMGLPITTNVLLPIIENSSDFSVVVKCFFAIYVIFALALTLKLIVSYFHLFALLSPKRETSYNSLEDKTYLNLLKKSKSTLGVNREIHLILHDKQVSPFSWMNYVVASRQDLDESGDEILLHELSHIKLYHSWDIIITDILTILQWFNPVVWLYKQSLLEVHEYKADESVLEAGVNAKQYQLLLIKKAVGQRFYSMSNSLNHSKIKNRITMMLKEESNKWAVAKCVYVLPLAFLTISVFANPRVSAQFEEISSVKGTQNPENISSFVEDVGIKVRGYGTMKPDSVKSGIFISEMKIDERPIVFVDGERYDEALDKLNPEMIESISVLKDESSISKYGSAGKNGVILITIKDKPFLVVEKMPTFNGGDLNVFRSWVMEQLGYHNVVGEKNENTVVLKFVVEKDGAILFAMTQSSSNAMIKEARRVIESSPKWTPGEQQGRKVRVSYTMAITFPSQK